LPPTQCQRLCRPLLSISFTNT